MRTSLYVYIISISVSVDWKTDPKCVQLRNTAKRDAKLSLAPLPLAINLFDGKTSLFASALGPFCLCTKILHLAKQRPPIYANAYTEIQDRSHIYGFNLYFSILKMGIAGLPSALREAGLKR